MKLIHICLAMKIRLLSFLLLVVAAQAAPRVWTDVNGRRVTGEFISVDPGNVIVLNVGGRSYAFPLNRLSPQDQAYARQLAAARTVAAPGHLSGSPNSAGAGDWPRWRGPHADGVSRETGLLKQWPSGGPRKLWTTTNLGRGYSSVVVAANLVFTLGESGGATSMHAVDRASGKRKWSTPIGGGGANGTPTFDPETGHVYGISKNGDLACLRASDGKLVWKIQFERDFGGKMMSGWGYSESPLVDGPILLCSPGARDAAIIALDKRTGRAIWKAPFPSGMGSKGKDGAGYGSIAIASPGGAKQYVQMTGRGLLAVEARTGKPLWHYNKIANGTANVPSPVVHGDRIFASTGYGDGGSALLQISRAGVKEVKYWTAGELQNHHGGMVLLEGHIYGGHGHNKGEPFCLDMRSGRILWKVDDPAVRKMKSASFTCADGQLYVRYENGTMKLIDASTRGYQEKGSFKIPDDTRNSWQHPVVAGGKLYLRAPDALHCYNVSTRG